MEYRNRQEPRSLMGNGADKCLGFSADANMLATVHSTGSDQDVIRFWDLSGATARNLIEKSLSRISSAAISPDGKIAAIGSGERAMSRVTLLDTSTWQEIATIDKVGTIVESLAFSPDGKTIAVALFKNTVLLFDVATGKPLRSMDGKAEWSLDSVVFSPDGKLLAACDGFTVKIWDAQTGQNLFTLGGGGNVYSVVFSPNGKLLASGNSAGGVKLFDVATGKLMRYLQGHKDMVGSLAFSPDGTKLATGSWDNTAAVWDVTEK